MRRLTYLFIALALALALLPATVFAHTESEPMIVDLLAGQTEDIGDVRVWNTADMLYVQFVSDVCMIETHVHVTDSLSSIPQKNGNPIPGKFEYSNYHGCSKNYTYQIPLTWSANTELYIAAHVALGQEETLVVFSDGGADTMVTAGNVSLATYPYPAVDAWEYNGDPLDPTPSAWDNALTYKGWTMADWVWEDYRTVDPTVTQYVTFEHAFNVPGYPMSSKLYIATDNTYDAYLNGGFVGQQTNYNNWSTVGIYDIFPVEGANLLRVVGSNYGNSSYNINSNPAGLIYEAEITYVASGETAWGCRESVNCFDFPGKNWATYFSYTVQQPILVDTLAVSSNGTPACTSGPLTNGENYLLKATGTYFYRSDGLSEADAEWAYRPSGENLGYGDGEWVKGDVADPPNNAYPSVFGLDVAQYIASTYVNIDWGDFNPGHSYDANLPGDGNLLCLKIYDSNYSDNSGSLTVEVWELP